LRGKKIILKYLQLGLVEGDKVSLVDLEAAAGPAKVWEVQHAVRGEQQIGLFSGAIFVP
jgi:hypothetical protein